MKHNLILLLNKEQKGFKFIKINDGFVVINLKSDIVGNDWVIDEDKNIFKVDYVDSYTKINNWSVIIFATPNLKLEGVPLIEEKDYEDEYTQNIINTKRIFHDEKLYDAHKLGFIEGIKHKEENSFTLEELKEAFEAGQLDKGNNWYDGDFNQFLQTIKQPKVKIIFEPNQCDGCNSNYPIENGIHKIPYPSGSISCQKDKYNKIIKVMFY